MRRALPFIVLAAALAAAAAARSAGTATPAATAISTPISTSTSTSTPTPTSTSTSTSTSTPTAPLVVEPAPRREAPLSLTASDGTGLALVALDARAVIRDPLAFTELRLVFRNPEDRVLEGRFRVTLPAGASLSRFAMRTADGWQEGEVVELEAARRAYEDFLHRRQDPALLEQAPGNEFSARVFPIPARGEKELVLSWSQELAGAAEPWRLPLAGLPRVDRLDVRVLDVSAGAARVALEAHRTDAVLPADLAVAPARRAGALRGAEVAVARVRPVDAAAADPLASALVLVDTSASRALGQEREIELVAALARAVAAAGGPGAPLVVQAFDQEAMPVYDGPAAKLGERALGDLRARGALGATDLARAIRAAEARLAASPGAVRRVVVISDGVATAGADDGEALRAAARALGKRGVERLDCVAVGGIRDRDALARLATAGLARDGAVVDGEGPLGEVVARLGRATRSGLAVEAEGAAWVWPARLDGVSAGDDVLVYAAVPAGAPLRLRVGGRAVPAEAASVSSAEEPLLSRAAARARIAALLAEREALPASDGARRDALRAAVVELSTRTRVVSPFTALLVLETEADYARFGLERRALARILTVGPEGLALVDRLPTRPLQLAGPTSPPARPSLRKAAATPSGAQAPTASGTAAPAARPDVGFADAPMQEKAEAAAPASRAEPPSAVEAAPPPAPAEAVASTPAPAAPPPLAAPRAAAAARPSEGSGRAEERRRDEDDRRESALAAEAPKRQRMPPYEGRFAEVMRLVARGEASRARAAAEAWRAAEPGDVLALVALGEALEASGDLARAARAYGSVIDLFPDRADLRRFAGNRLERLGAAKPDAAARDLAADTYRKAVAQRPDHPAGHRLLAYALLRAGDPEGAFDALAAGLAREYPAGRFAGAREILEEDLGLVAAAWARAEPGRAAAILARAEALGAAREDRPSTRFVLTWETDANDVDFHITDRDGAEAYYGRPELPSGGRLYADVTTGYGPECFTIRGAPAAAPYHLEAHYYSRGPMGYGMGKLEIVRHDGKGGLAFEERPFVVMADGAYVDLGTVR